MIKSLFEELEDFYRAIMRLAISLLTALFTLLCTWVVVYMSERLKIKNKKKRKGVNEMAILRNTVVYSTAVVGYDMLQNHPARVMPQNRRISRLGFTGGAGVGDSGGELFVGQVSQGSFKNTSTGDSPKLDTDLLPVSIRVPAGTPIRFVIDDAAPSANVSIMISADDTGYGSSGGRSGYKRRSTSYTRTRRSSGSTRMGRGA